MVPVLYNETGGLTSTVCVRQWFRTAEPLGERRYENWNTHTHTHTTSTVSFDYGQAQCQEVQPWIYSTWPLGDNGGFCNLDISGPLGLPLLRWT